MPDLFDAPAEEPRQKGREAFKRLVGRYPMTRYEKDAHRTAQQASYSAGRRILGGAFSVETNALERNPEFIDTKGMSINDDEEDE